MKHPGLGGLTKSLNYVVTLGGTAWSIMNWSQC